MRKPRKNKLLHQPSYPGGMKAMSEFIARNLRYPPEALKAGIEGTVLVKYAVNEKGVVVSTQVIHGLGYGCDQEAVRIVRLLKFNIKKIEGRNLKYNKRIRIHFKLPPKKPTPTKLLYSTPPKDSGETGGYSYEIEV